VSAEKVTDPGPDALDIPVRLIDDMLDAMIENFPITCGEKVVATKT